MNITNWLRTLALTAVVLIGFGSASAQELLNAKQAEKVASEVASRYKDWHSASRTGKVKADMLPVSITARIFMVRDSLTLISLRAPLMGEMARIEIDNQCLTIVNKMKKLYYSMNLGGMGCDVATLHSNLQDLLLGRVTILNAGTLSKKNVREGDVFKVSDDVYLISLNIGVGDEIVNYGYAFDKQGRVLQLLVSQGKPHSEPAPEGMESEIVTISNSLAVEVIYTQKSADVAINAKAGKRQLAARLSDVTLEWGGKGFERINLTKGYTRCNSINELMKF